MPVFLIGLSGLLVYANSFHGPFVFDDSESIMDNPTIRHLSPLRHVLFPEVGVLSKRITVEGRPLLNLSFALNYAVSHLEVWSYHAVNLVIHVLAGLTLFGIVRRTMLRFESSGKLGVGTSTWLALVVALLWVVHPLQTESVTYMVQRAESLVGLLYLFTFYLSIRAMESPEEKRGQVGAVVVCALGMTAKEVMVTAPVIVLLYDSMFVGGSFRQALRERRGFYVALFSTWAVLAALLLWTGGASLGLIKALFSQASGQMEASATVQEMNWLDYALTQFGAIVQYLRLCIWPSPLVFDYGNGVAHGFWEIVPAGILVGLLLAATLLGLWRRHWAGFAGVWFFLILSPTTSVVPLSGQTMAEHRMYLPLAGVLLLLVGGGYAVWRRLQGRVTWNKWLPAMLVTLFVMGLGGMTLLRNRDYHSDFSIWQDTILKNPTSPTAHNNLGVALLRMGKVDEALSCFQKAVELKPDYTSAFSNIGSALVQMGQVDEAMVNFEKTLELDSSSDVACNNLGAAYLKKGQVDKALAYCQSAIKHNPSNADAHYNVANALFQKERMDEALVHYRRALELKPDFTLAHANMGVILLNKGLVDEALLHYELAIKINPLDLGTLNNLAWIMSTSSESSQRNGTRALELAQRANEISGGKHSIVLRTLAAAYAECGRFTEAAEVAGRGQTVAGAQGNTGLGDHLRNDRGLYLAGKPVRVINTKAP